MLPHAVTGSWLNRVLAYEKRRAQLFGPRPFGWRDRYDELSWIAETTNEYGKELGGHVLTVVRKQQGDEADEVEESGGEDEQPSNGAQGRRLFTVAQVYGTVNKVELEDLVVDSAATVNLVSEVFLKTLQARQDIRLYKYVSTLRGIGVGKSIGHVFLDVTLGVRGGRPRSLKFTVVPDPGRPLLLGIPGLKAFKATLDFDGEELTYDSSGSGLKRTTPMRIAYGRTTTDGSTYYGNVRVPVYVAEDSVRLEAEMVTHVKSAPGNDLPHCGDGYLVDGNKGTQEGGLWIPSMTVKPDRHGTWLTPVANLTKTTRRLRKGQLLGWIDVRNDDVAVERVPEALLTEPSQVAEWLMARHFPDGNVAGEDGQGQDEIRDLMRWRRVQEEKPATPDEDRQSYEPPNGEVQTGMDALEALELSHLTAEQREELKGMLKRNADAFDPTIPSKPNIPYEHHMVIKEGTQPISYPPRRAGPAKEQVIREHLDQMLKDGVIRPSRSAWAAPVSLVKKPGGGLRFVTDYRELNANTIPDKYPLPRVDTTIDYLAGKRWFTIMDLRWGFWQIPIKEDHKHYTAFCTPHGLFEYNKLPFGLRNSPPTFQRVMDAVLAGIKYSFCLAYVDDIIVFSDKFDEHVKHIDQVLGRIREAGLRIKLEKCRFAESELKFLGKVVNCRGVTVDPAKVDGILELKAPTNLSALQSFLGMCVFHARHIPNYTARCAPLYALLRKDAAWRWGTVEQAAFEEVRDGIRQAALLEFPEPDLPLILSVDASKCGLGAALYKVKDKKRYPIALLSKSLTDTETRYTNTEREGLAVVWAIQTLDSYLWGNKFTVETDHSPLLPLRSKGDLSGKWARWSYAVADYDFVLVHKPGKSLSHRTPDLLSRAYDGPAKRRTVGVQTGGASGQGAVTVETEPDEEVFLTVAPLVHGTPEDLATRQQDDTKVGGYYRYVKTGEAEEADRKRLARQTSTMILNNDVLYRVYRLDRAGFRSRLFQQLVLPTGLRRQALEQCHDDLVSGHLGRDRTLRRVQESYWWPGWHQDTVNHVKSCVRCSATKPSPKLRVGNLNPVVVNDVWEKLGVDIVGRLPTTGRGNRYVVVLTDYLSKWVEAFAVPDITVNRVARRIVEDVFCRYGVPGSLVSDRGQPFVSKLQQRILRLLGTVPAFTSPYHPEADGLTERFNGTLVKMISCYVNEQTHDDWDVQLPYLLLAYRTAFHQSTHESPFYLMFGRDVRLPKDLLQHSYHDWEQTEEEPEVRHDIDVRDYKQEVQQRLQKAWESARANIREAQQLQRTWYDRVSHLDGCGFREGDKVWLAVPKFTRSARSEKQTTVEKFAVKWTGPHRVISHNGPTFKLLEVVSPTEVIYRQAHARRLRHWTNRKPVDPDEIPLLTDDEILDEELKIAETAAVLQRKPFRPKAYGTSKELVRRGIDPDGGSDDDDLAHDDDGNAQDDNDDDWEVERLVAHRDTPSGRTFLVKWKYWPSRHNSWLTREQLKHAPAIVQAYEAPLPRQPPVADNSPPRRSNRLKKGGGARKAPTRDGEATEDADVRLTEVKEAAGEAPRVNPNPNPLPLTPTSRSTLPFQLVGVTPLVRLRLGWTTVSGPYGLSLAKSGVAQ